MKGASLGADGRTIDITFRDGAEEIILPPAMVRLPLRPALLRTHWARPHQQTSGANDRAIVLEPFADELHLGPSAGQAEADTLTRAGFHVDILRNADVTVEAMEGLANYSVVYMETHSGALPDGDALVMTGTTNNNAYPSFYAEQSLLQGIVAGDPTGALYNGIRAKFVSLHMGRFPNSSIMFINGCSVLMAPLFWEALHQQNVDTLLSWDGEADSSMTELDGQFVLGEMTGGKDVATALATARSQGYASSVFKNDIVHLGLLGDGSDTLARALAGSDPAPAATATPLPTATPTVTPKPAKPKRCKAGMHLVHGKCKKRRRK